MFAAAALLLAAGCADEPRVTLRILPPEPLPAAEKPVDSDGDGFSDARDRCPQAAEDGASPEPDDGCPGAPPDAGPP